MKTIFWKELKLTRKGLSAWVAIMLVTAAFGAMEYPMVSENIEIILQGIGAMPEIVIIMFGVPMDMPVDSPLWYYVTMYFWYALIAFTHAAFVGAIIIAKEERDKTAEYIFTKPYKRSTIITAKILVGVVNVFIMTLATWLFNVIALAPLIGGHSLMGVIAITTLGMFLTQLVFLAIGLFCSALFKKHRIALISAILVVLASYFIAVIIEYGGNIDYLNFLSPFRYFHAQAVINDGISLLYLLIAAVIASVSIYFTYTLYNKRDLLA